MSFRLRLRLPSGPTVLTSLAPPSTYGELLVLVRAHAKVELSQSLTLKSGYPPKPMSLGAEDSLQNSVRNGDTLIVTVGEPSPNRQAAPKPTRKCKAASKATSKKSVTTAATGKWLAGGQQGMA